MDVNKLAELLKESQAPDTQKLKAITSELQKNYYSHPQSLLLLVEIIATRPEADLRQQAAVQAARLVPKHWNAIPKEQKPAVRQHLVQAGLKEDDAKARHAESRVIAAIASIDWDDGEWPELTPALFNLATNSNASQREIGTYIIFTVLETNPTAFNDHVPKLLELFGRTLRDPQSSDVRINTMLSIGAMLMLIDTETDKEAVESLQNLIPPMVDVLKDAIQQEDEEKIQQAFEVFQQFLAYESSLMSKHLKNLVQFMLDLAANADADDDVRSQALAFLAQTVRYRRMKIQAMKDMGAQLTLKSMDILTEIDDDEEDEAMSPARSALALLDQLASDLPPRMILVPLLDAFPKFAASEEPGRRKAGILALGACVEGAPDFVATQLKTILPPIIALLNDANIDVRHDALVGLSRIAEEIAEELASEHEALMTALAKNLQAAMAPAADEKSAKRNAAIIRSACGALDSLTEGFSAEIMKQYAPRLVENLQSLLDHDDPKVKSAAAGAIGAIAEALDEDFKPYFQKTVQSLGQYLTIKESEDDLVLRSGVCDAMGRIATAVGAEAFQPYVMPLMRSSEEALNLDDSRLKESSFILWSALAKVYEHDFAEFLPGVFKGLSASLELEEEEVTLELTEEEQGIIAGAQEMITAGKKVKLRTTNPVEEVDDMEEDDDDEADWDDIMGVSTEALEKEVAIEVLGDIISHAWGPAEVTEYLERAIEQVTPLIEHSYEGCRKAAIGTLWRAYARVWQLWEEETGTSWTPGYPPKQTPSAPLLKLGEIVATATLSMWSDEADRAVVTEINRNISATLKATGPAILAQQDMLTQTITALGSLITRSHPCQQDLGDEEDEQEVEGGSAEYDWLVIDTALDVIIGLSVAMGPNFSELWKIFEKPIMKFASSQESIERSTAVGVIAECVANMGAGVSPFTPELLTLLVHRLSDEDNETKSNAAYATGQLISNSTNSEAYLPQYNGILAKLEPMLHIKESRILDNAAGCVCRMIMKHADRVPVSEVLPALVDLLPLKEDYEENKPVYECIYKLYDDHNPTIQALTPKLIPVFAQVLGPPEEQLEAETRTLLTNAVKMLAKAQPALFQGHEDLVRLVQAA